jgi:uncharacterized protein (DUF952 family)
MGITIFTGVRAAIRAGFIIDSPIPDADGFLHASTHSDGVLARALVRPENDLFG